MLLPLALVVLCGPSGGFQPVVANMSGSYIAAVVHTKDGKAHMFLLDSGSNESYVSEAVVSDGERKHDEAEIRFDVGPTQVFGNAEPVPPSKIEASINGLQTEGVLGLNILKQIQLDIDYDARTVGARYGSPLTGAGPGFTTLLLDRDPDNLYTVAGQIGTKYVRLCVDTGASALVVDSGRVDLGPLQKLPAAKLRTFGGSPEASRFLVESIRLGDHDFPWMIAYSKSWKTSDDGTIGTCQLGSSRLILDFPGSCAYLAKSDPISEAAERVLGIPVRVDADALRFRDNLPDGFKSSSGARIVAIRGTSADTIVAALKSKGREATKTLADVFAAIRVMGLVTTERDGQRTLVPLQVQD